jgi:hypothetical protein
VSYHQPSHEPKQVNCGNAAQLQGCRIRYRLVFTVHLNPTVITISAMPRHTIFIMQKSCVDSHALIPSLIHSLFIP